jgi:hypothetical protein
MRITQEDCAPEVMQTTQAATVKWEIEAGKPEPGQYFAVFRVRFEFSGPSGEVWLVVPEDDLVSIADSRPAGIITHRKARPKRRVSPEFPSAATTEDGDVRCTISLDVTVNGRGNNLEVSGCDEVYAAEALKAVKQWRWYPERRNGKEEVVSKTIQIAFSR